MYIFLPADVNALLFERGAPGNLPVISNTTLYAQWDRLAKFIYKAKGDSKLAFVRTGEQVAVDGEDPLGFCVATKLAPGKRVQWMVEQGRQRRRYIEKPLMRNHPDGKSCKQPYKTLHLPRRTGSTLTKTVSCSPEGISLLAVLRMQQVYSSQTGFTSTMQPALGSSFPFLITRASM